MLLRWISDQNPSILARFSASTAIQLKVEQNVPKWEKDETPFPTKLANGRMVRVSSEVVDSVEFPNNQFHQVFPKAIEVTLSRVLPIAFPVLIQEC